MVLFYQTGIAQKKELSISDFDSWNRIENQKISNNGNFISYEINPNKGDGKLIVYNVVNRVNDTINYGHSALFSNCSKYLALRVKTPEDSIRKLKLAKVKSENMPKDTLVIINLSNNNRSKYPGLISYKISEEGNSWLAFLSEFQKPKADTSQTNKKKPTPAKGKKNKDTDVLTIMNPLTNTQFIFNRVTQYEISKRGNSIALTSKLTDTTEVFGLILFNTLTQKIDTILRENSTIKRLTFDEVGNQIAFLHSNDTIAEKKYSLYYSPIGKYNLQKIVDTTSVNIPKGWMPSDNGSVSFSKDGSKLFFGTAPIPKKAKKESVLDEEIPKLDLWSWTDQDIQPRQLRNVIGERRKTYLALYRIKEKKTIQLADTIISEIRLTSNNNSEIALAMDDSPYRRSRVWSTEYLSDYYLVDLKTGKRTPLLKANGRLQLSPQGKYAIWYNQNDSSFYLADTKTQKVLSLTKQIPVAFYDEENDTPSKPGPYGIMGWSENDESVYINDRFDIWKIDPKGKQNATNITRGEGRKTNTTFRYIRLDRDLEFIPNNILLSAFNEKSLQDGYYSLSINNPSSLRQLVMGDFRTGSIIKSKDTSHAIWSKQTVSDFPEIIVSELDFKNQTTISKANPQQSNFVWPTAEIVEWVSFAGDSLRGILYKPSNFDATKKYPMISYFYERSSQGLHRYHVPQPSRSTINISLYVSNGYIVFVPDIVYRTGYPGQSAYDAIVSGVYSLINSRKYIDSKKLGLQGQSWGGYQTAYLITQTDLFAAAMAGAPVSNMTSAYGGIRWGTGMSRMFQYEETQSRIGGTLWDKPMLYLENSPLFMAPRVNTPLLMMHNDNDGAVPWYQSIEMFMALYRLNKPVWLLNYNGMDHNIESKFWANRVDLSTRMFQFFNHYLKDQSVPKWMEKGIPAIDKGTDMAY
jgi:dipeptidyl aminopeptidase/acylaminoacyl peptidase